MTLAGSPLALGWAFCHSHNKPLGQLRVWGPRPGLCPPGAQPPPQPRGPPRGSPHTVGPATRPERRGCGQPHPCSPAWSPPQGGDLIPYPPHLYQAGLPQEGKTEAAQLPNPTHGGKRTRGGQWPRNTAAPPTPCSVGGWRALGVRSHPPPRARSWGEEGDGRGTATSSLPQVSGPHHLSLGPGQLGGMLSWCPTAPLTSTHPRLWLAPPCSLCSPTCGSSRCPV